MIISTNAPRPFLKACIFKSRGFIISREGSIFSKKSKSQKCSQYSKLLIGTTFGFIESHLSVLEHLIFVFLSQKGSWTIFKAYIFISRGYRISGEGSKIDKFVNIKGRKLYALSGTITLALSGINVIVNFFLFRLLHLKQVYKLNLQTCNLLLIDLSTSNF